MPKFDKEFLRKGYEEVCPKYERLAKNLREALEIFLDEKGIDYVGVFYRVKEFDSFWDKMRRKGYSNPFEQTEDICGVRIVCLYDSDLKKIARIINKEFDDVKEVDKSDELKPDQFGYRSIHLTFTVKKSWLKSPHYRGLGKLRAEVQIRTTLMHSWAEIEEKLRYKKDDYPEELDREFSRLSAKLEEADEQFDKLRKAKERYRKKLLSKQAKESGRFDVNQPLNTDSLQAFLDFYFPNRKKIDAATKYLLERMQTTGTSMRELVESYEKVKDIWEEMEIDYIQKKYLPEEWETTKLPQGSLGLIILDVTHKKFWEFRENLDLHPIWKEIINRWRKTLSEHKD